MELKICSFELAKLLKGKGFDVKVNQCYRNGGLYNKELIIGNSPYNMNNPEEQELWSCELYSAPTLELVCKWLRDRHKIVIYPTINIYTDLYGYEFYNGFNTDKFETVEYDSDSEKWNFKTYEEAQEAAIIEALNLIK